MTSVDKIICKIKDSEIIQSVMTLSIGTVVAQAIPIFASLILARLYSPDDYGNWGIFSSYATILTVLICGRYEYAILRPKRLVDAFNLCLLSFFIGGTILLLLYILLGVFYLTQFSVITSIKGILWLPIYVFFSGVLQVLSNYANREEHYKSIAFSSIFRSCIQASSRIILGWGMKIREGLILGALLGLVFGVFFLFKRISLYRIFSSLSFRRMKELAIEYKKFPIYEVPSGLLNVMSTSIPLLLLSYFFAKEYVGYFSMAITILYMPMSFIGMALGQIFYKKTCVWKDQNQIARLGLKMFKLTFFLGLIPVLVLTLFGDVLFAFLLGKQWETTGIFAMFMSVWLWFVLCFSPLSTIFWVKDKQRLGMVLNLGMLIIRVIAVLIGACILKSVFLTVFLYGIMGVILWSIQGWYVWKLVNIRLRGSSKISILLLSISMFIIWGIEVVSKF